MSREDRMYTVSSKFYETFGVNLKENVDLCDICDYKGESECKKCPAFGHSMEWDEYRDPKKYDSFKDTKQLLLDALSKHSDAVIATAYSFAYHLDKYGVDVSEKWNNEVENTQALEKAYNKGYFDALLEMENNKNRGSDEGKWIHEPNNYVRCSRCGYHYPHTSIYSSKMDWNYCPNCGKEMEDAK